MTNISLFIKDEATEFGISRFSGSFLGPGVTLEKMLVQTARIVTQSIQKQCHQSYKRVKVEKQRKSFNYRIVPIIRTEQAMVRPGTEPGLKFLIAVGQAEQRVQDVGHEQQSMSREDSAGCLD